MSGILLHLGNSRKSKCNSKEASKDTQSSGGQRPKNGVIRLGECSGATEGQSARLGGVRGSILVKVILEMSYKRQGGFSQAITGRWRETF